MTRDEFTAKWRPRLSGIAICGLIDYVQKPVSLSTRCLEIPAMVESLLTEMLRDMQTVLAQPPKATAPPAAPPQPVVQGQPPQRR